MGIELNHLHVPTHDTQTSAKTLARILDVMWSENGMGPTCTVFINDGLAFNFEPAQGEVPVYSFCFRVDDDRFDEIVSNLKTMGISFRQTSDGDVGDLKNTSYQGGRIVYWTEPDGHAWEATTLNHQVNLNRRTP